jgi:hypothetical protein
MESRGSQRPWTAGFDGRIDAKLRLLPLSPLRGVDMSYFLLSSLAGIPPGIEADPAALAGVPPKVLASAEELRSAAPALLSAWDQASAALADARTGEVLGASRPGAAAALEACAAAVDALAAGLRRSAIAYAGVESAALPPGSAGDRAQAWMP